MCPLYALVFKKHQIFFDVMHKLICAISLKNRGTLLHALDFSEPVIRPVARPFFGRWSRGVTFFRSKQYVPSSKDPP